MHCQYAGTSSAAVGAAGQRPCHNCIYIYTYCICTIFKPMHAVIHSTTQHNHNP